MSQNPLSLKKNHKLLSDYLKDKLKWRFATEKAKEKVILVGEACLEADQSINVFSFKLDIRKEGVFSIVNCPFSIKGDSEKICELLVRLNRRMWYGKFDYNIEKGSVCFRYFQDLGIIESLMAGTLERVTELPFAVVSRFLPVFDEVISGKKSPQEAVSDFYDKL